MLKNLTLKPGVVIILLLLLPPIFFWYPYANFSEIKPALLSLGQITALIGFILLSVNFILSTRIKVLESLFNGLNQMYIVHHIIGVTAFILILAHPTLIIFSYILSSLSIAFALIIPSKENIPVIFGTIALDVMIVLLVITLFIKIKYNIWKATHKYLGITLFLASVHILLIGSTIAQNPALKAYMVFFMIAGLTSYLYYSILGKFTVPKKKFVISKNIELSDNIIELWLKPATNFRFNFNPGQFVFINPSGLGIPKESHPFSIVSKREDNQIKLGIKTLGDYTNALRLAKQGTEVQIEGPYGRFGYNYQNIPKQLWIAAGIGITPFVGLLKGLTKPHDITLIYSVSSAKDAVYKEIFKSYTNTNPNFKFKLWDSSRSGRLSANQVLADSPDTHHREIYICGPTKLMSEFKKQFIESGVPVNKIHTEEFSLN